MRPWPYEYLCCSLLAARGALSLLAMVPATAKKGPLWRSNKRAKTAKIERIFFNIVKTAILQAKKCHKIVQKVPKILKNVQKRQKLPITPYSHNPPKEKSLFVNKNGRCSQLPFPLLGQKSPGMLSFSGSLCWSGVGVGVVPQKG